MAKTYSLDLRERVVKDYDGGVPIEDLVLHDEVSRSWIYSLLPHRRKTGSIAPKQYKPGAKRKLAPYENEVLQLVADHSDATLEELHALLPHKDEVTVVTLHHFLHRLKITWKKTLHAAEQHREDVAEERAEWEKLQTTFDIKRLVFIDETWTKTNMTPLRGRAEIGKRVIDDVPHGHWMTTTLMAALRLDGLTAPMVVDGAINGELFLGYVEQFLLPTLNEGDIVVMDNLSSHKVAGVKKAIESVGAKVLYLPPYSPDFNPIENVFSKLKTLVRKLKLRKQDELWRKLGERCDVFSPDECQNYFRHAGYTNVQTNF
jgi:transposase